MKCRCPENKSDSKILCVGIGEVDVIIIMVNNVGATTVTCEKDIEEMYIEAKLVIVEKRGDKRVARIYV
jgi:hypothetical protein